MQRSIKTLFIQLRPDQATREHELRCFLKKSKLSSNTVKTINLFEEYPSKEDIRSADVVVIGGSGDYLISNNDIPEETKKVAKIAVEARNQGKAILGICFGAQILAFVFGGKIVCDQEKEEIGTFPITKCKKAEVCPIFKHLPQVFDVQLGHKDHIVQLPEHAINLAFSKKSAIQAFTFPGERIYGLTFHPELDVEDLHWRLDYYAKNYDLDEKKLEILKKATWATPEGSKVLDLFFQHIVQEKDCYPSES